MGFDTHQYWITGFEAGDFSTLSSFGVVAIQSTKKRSGLYALKVTRSSSSGAGIQHKHTTGFNQTDFQLGNLFNQQHRVFFMLESYPSVNNLRIYGSTPADNNGTPVGSQMKFYVEMDTSGNVRIVDDFGNHGVYAGALSLNVWYELVAGISGTSRLGGVFGVGTMTMTVKTEGGTLKTSQSLSYTGADAGAFGDIVCGQSVGGTVGSMIIYYDDVTCFWELYSGTAPVGQPAYPRGKLPTQRDVLGCVGVLPRLDYGDTSSPWTPTGSISNITDRPWDGTSTGLAATKPNTSTGFYLPTAGTIGFNGSGSVVGIVTIANVSCSPSDGPFFFGTSFGGNQEFTGGGTQSSFTTYDTTMGSANAATKHYGEWGPWSSSFDDPTQGPRAFLIISGVAGGVGTFTVENVVFELLGTKSGGPDDWFGPPPGSTLGADPGSTSDAQFPSTSSPVEALPGPGPGYGWLPVAPPDPHGWWRSDENFAGGSTVIGAGSPANPRGYEEISAFATGNAQVFGGSPGCAVTFNGKMIYPAGGYTVGTIAPSIRIFDGVTDRALISIPNTSAGAVPKAILSMMIAEGLIYLSTLDAGSSSADWTGRVFEYDVTSGVLTPLGDAAFVSGQAPYALAWHMGRLWVGSNKGDGTAGKVFWIRPGVDTVWTVDRSLSTDSLGGVCSMCSYNGTLYVGSDASAATFAKVLARDTTGAYTTSITATGGTAKVNNGFLSMALLGGALYVGYWNNDTTPIAKVYKNILGVITTAYNGATTTLRPFVGMMVDPGTASLYLIGGGGTGESVCLLSTPDGATWTNKSVFLPGVGDGSTAIPAFGIVRI